MSLRAEDFGRVAVLMGGWAAEREVSLVSGQAVLEGLLRCGIDADGIDVDRQILTRLVDGAYDRVFNVLHGRGGEDGEIQGGLDLLEIPYTGSGVLGSAVGMDKYRSKLLFNASGLPTPEFQLIRSEADLGSVAELGFPLMIKPALEGSSIGMSRVDDVGQLKAAWRKAAEHHSHVLAEAWVSGAEYTVAVLGDRALPVIKLETPHDFYDYDAKYVADDTQYLIPCGLPAEQEQRLQRLSLDAFAAIGATGWGRVDILTDEFGQPYVIEVNTVPGMTSHSLVPMAAEAAGLSFDDLVWAILAQTLEVA